MEPYQFELTTVTRYNDEDVVTQMNQKLMCKNRWVFKKCFGKIDCCSCLRCIPMSRGIECQCCREMDAVHERLTEQEEINCITSHDQFSIVYYNKNILYAVLVMMNKERCEPM